MTILGLFRPPGGFALDTTASDPRVLYYVDPSMSTLYVHLKVYAPPPPVMNLLLTSAQAQMYHGGWQYKPLIRTLCWHSVL